MKSSRVVVAGLLAVAGCGRAGVGSPSDVVPPVATDELLPGASTTLPPDGCGDVPEVALASGDGRVTMDLVFYEESSGA